MKKNIYIVLLFSCSLLHAQKKDVPPSDLDEYILVKEGDTLTINLDEISVIPKLKFKSPTDARYYYWFQRKVFKAYPFAIIASKRLDWVTGRKTLCSPRWQLV